MDACPADPKIVELGLVAAEDHAEVVRAEYEGYTRNALVQLRRVREGTQIGFRYPLIAIRDKLGSESSMGESDVEARTAALERRLRSREGCSRTCTTASRTTCA